MAPPDYQQGDAYRILYIHVPLAAFSLGIYLAMAVAAAVHWIWKIKVADIVASQLLPLGAMVTALTLVTGSIWGHPMWGTWWIWDARLTSELILLFLYLGVMALRHSLPTLVLQQRVSSVLVIVGVVNLPVIHYSVTWWNTLHQGATILKWGRPSLPSSMLVPLLWMMGAMFLYIVWWMSCQIQSEILKRESRTAWVKAMRSQLP